MCKRRFLVRHVGETGNPLQRVEVCEHDGEGYNVRNHIVGSVSVEGTILMLRVNYPECEIVLSV